MRDIKKLSGLDSFFFVGCIVPTVRIPYSPQKMKPALGAGFVVRKVPFGCNCVFSQTAPKEKSDKCLFGEQK